MIGPNLHKIGRKLRRAILRDEPGYYDMFENPGERYFARLYLHRIRQTLQQREGQGPLTLLDAGCQAGRLAVPLGREGHRVIGVDTSDLALHRARRHAREQGVRLELVRANLGRWLPKQPEGRFDGVICTEVLYLRKNHQLLLQGLIRVLKPGGLCFISHRPPCYYLAEAFQRRDPAAVEQLCNGEEGLLFGSYYNWQDRAELERIYPALGVEILSIAPIGLLSWLSVPPDQLDEPWQDRLFQAELELSRSCPDAGRYLLVSGRKNIRVAPVANR